MEIDKLREDDLLDLKHEAKNTQHHEKKKP